MYVTVTPRNALLVALRHYDNPQCVSLAEFRDDYKVFTYIKCLCQRYLKTRQMNERLMLNHLVTLHNLFGSEITAQLLFLKCRQTATWSILKTFLTFMQRLPDVVRVNGADIYTTDIPLDTTLWNRLQSL